MQLSAEIRIRVPADLAWDLVGTRFGSIATWAGPISASSLDTPTTGVGSVRTCHVAGFGPMRRMVLRERLLEFDAAGRTLTYEALSGMPSFVRGATNRWSVHPDEGEAGPDGPGACVVRTRATLRLAWWLRPLGPVLAARLRREATGVLEQLAHHLETGRPHLRPAAAGPEPGAAPSPAPDARRAPTVER